MNTLQLIQEYLDQPNYSTSLPVFCVHETESSYVRPFLIEKTAKAYAKNNNIMRNRSISICSSMAEESEIVTMLKHLAYIHMENLTKEQIAHAKNIGIFPYDLI